MSCSTLPWRSRSSDSPNSSYDPLAPPPITTAPRSPYSSRRGVRLLPLTKCELKTMKQLSSNSRMNWVSLACPGFHHIAHGHKVEPLPGVRQHEVWEQV